MSSFACWAVVDLLPGRTSAELIHRMRSDSALPNERDEVFVKAYDGGRVYILADFQPSYGAYVTSLARVLAARAIIAADWDEFGVENDVLGPGGEVIHRAVIREYDDGDDTTETRRRAAALFGVDVARLDNVSATWATTGAMPSMPGHPYLQWWDALGVRWPDDFHDGAVNLRGDAAME